MTKKMIMTLFLSFLICSGYGPAWALNPADMARLTRAGLSGKVIQTIMDEKAIETCAFTVDQIIDLKKSGMSDQTIEDIIKKGSFMNGPQKVVYGDSTKTLKNISPEEMVKLKKAGISDDVLREIAKGNMEKGDPEYQRAWDMLDSMGVLVDSRRILE